MRNYSRMVCVAALMLFTLPLYGADELVRSLDVKIEGARGRANQPTVVEKQEELEKALGNKETAEKIAKLVDFSKEKVVVFRWSGSGQDKITASEKEGEVVFQYKPGLTRDLRPHGLVFSIKKDAKFQVVTGR